MRDGTIHCAGCDKKLGYSWEAEAPERHLIEECFEELRGQIKNLKETLESHNLR